MTTVTDQQSVFSSTSDVYRFGDAPHGDTPNLIEQFNTSLVTETRRVALEDLLRWSLESADLDWDHARQIDERGWGSPKR